MRVAAVAGLLAIFAGALLAWRPRAEPVAAAMPKPSTVRVAAVQFHSVMGDVKGNRAGLAALVRQAAAGGAKIVVLPEAAVSGYADLDANAFWTAADPPEEGNVPVREVAESADGETPRFFAALARELGIYVTVPFIEVAAGKFYNTALLVGPDGRTLIHYRKQHPWTVADPAWMTRGDLGAPVVATEYGRIGVMICADVNEVLPQLAENRADIVLHCVAWYGPWFDVRFNGRVRDAGVTLVLANWTFSETPSFRGAGASRVIGPDGEEIARIDHDLGDGILFANLPVAQH